MKPPPRKRTRTSRDLAPVPQPRGRAAVKWPQTELKKLLAALHRLRPRDPSTRETLDPERVREYLPTRTAAEINVVLESLKGKLVSFVKNRERSERNEARRTQKPLETWIQQASAMSGPEEDTLHQAFTQVLAVASIEPQTLMSRSRRQPRPSAPPQSTGSSSASSTSASITSASITSASIASASSTSASITSASSSSASITSASSSSASITSTSSSSASITSAPITSTSSSSAPIASASSSSASITSASITSASITSASITSASITSASITSASITSASSSSASIASASITSASSSSSQLHQAPSVTPPAPPPPSTEDVKSPSPRPHSPSTAQRPPDPDTSSKSSVKKPPLVHNQMTEVSFERIYYYLSALHKPNEQVKLTPMESAILLDLLMSLPEELQLLDCDKLCSHFCQVHLEMSGATEDSPSGVKTPHPEDGGAQTKTHPLLNPFLIPLGLLSRKDPPGPT